MIKKFSEREILMEIEQGRSRKWEPDRRIYDKLNEIIDVLNEEVIEEEFYLSWQSPLMIPPEDEDLLIDTDDGYRIARSHLSVRGEFATPEWVWVVAPHVGIENSRVKRWAYLPKK